LLLERLLVLGRLVHLVLALLLGRLVLVLLRERLVLELLLERLGLELLQEHLGQELHLELRVLASTGLALAHLALV